MTPLNYTHLQELGFTLLIPIIQDKTDRNEALTMWAKETNQRVIRLELHKKKTKLQMMKVALKKTMLLFTLKD